VNWELWSAIEKKKVDKARHKADRKQEYLQMLMLQGIDTSKIDPDSIVFEGEDDEEESNEGHMEVIE